MKKIFTLLTVFVLMFSFAAVSAETAYFMCDSDPADFNGKEFDDLRVLLNGCTNFDSTVIPGSDAFVTLKDITVNGTLYLVDATYDRETDTYYEAAIGENTTTTDFYLNIAGKSYIHKAHVESIDPHVVNFGIQYPTQVYEMEIVPVNDESRGNIVVRGYIDLLVDEATDYYTDTTVASFPDFDIETFDHDFLGDFLKAEKEEIWIVEGEERHLADDDEKLWNHFAFLTQDLAFNISSSVDYPYPGNIMAAKSFVEYNNIMTDEWHLLERGNISICYIFNGYEQNSGNVNVDFANINIEHLFLAGGGFGEQTADLKSSNWVPDIHARGFVTVGVLASDVSFRTDVYNSDCVHTPDLPADGCRTTPFLPLYVDFMLLGGEGRTIRYTMNDTHVQMMNYLGNENAGSKLELRTEDKSHLYYDYARFEEAYIMGGKLDIGCEWSRKEWPIIQDLYFYEGNPDYQFSDGFIAALYYRLFPDSETYTVDVSDDNLPFRDWHPIATYAGHAARIYALDKYLHSGNVDMKGKSVISLRTENVALENVYVSKNLDPINSWFSRSCHFCQYGEEKGNAIVAEEAEN